MLFNFNRLIMLQKEKIDRNYNLFMSKLKELGIETNILQERYGDSIKNASFSSRNYDGTAYEGSLLDVILYHLTPIALKENDSFEEFKVDKNKIIKICLLQHISKAVRMVKNDNAWEIRERKVIFKYNENNPALRTGLHSVAILQECGINLSVDEIEAITIIDKEENDSQSNLFSSVCAEIVRIANIKNYIFYRERNKNNK